VSSEDLSLLPGFAQLLLEELIYEQLCTQIDLFRLGCFEDDLDATIRRVLDGLAGTGSDPPSHVIAAALVERAWSRLDDEWRANRGGTACPSCALQVPA
jgi:hypothetical protein